MPAKKKVVKKRRTTKRKATPRKHKVNPVEEVFEENLREAEFDAHSHRSYYAMQLGILGFFFGFIGLFTPFPFPIILGILAGSLGSFANKHGQRGLGIVCGFLALLNLLYFVTFFWLVVFG